MQSWEIQKDYRRRSVGPSSQGHPPPSPARPGDLLKALASSWGGAETQGLDTDAAAPSVWVQDWAESVWPVPSGRGAGSRRATLGSYIPHLSRRVVIAACVISWPGTCLWINNTYNSQRAPWRGAGQLKVCLTIILLAFIQPVLLKYSPQLTTGIEKSLKMPIVLISGAASSVPQNLFERKKSQKVNSTPCVEIKANVSFTWSCLGLAAFKMFQGIFFLSFFPLPKLPSLFGDPICPPAFSTVSLIALPETDWMWGHKGTMRLVTRGKKPPACI